MRWILLLALAGTLPGFDPDKHRDMTETALKRAARGFTATAILEVQNANECVDLEVPVLDSGEDYDRPCLPASYFCVGCQKAARNHFDDEALHEGSAQLARLQDMFVEAARTGHPIEARKLLGFALHAIQDFYSHSNWVELGNGRIFESLTSLDTYRPDHSVPGTLTWHQPLIAGPKTKVCNEGAILLPVASARGSVLTTGYFFKNGEWGATGAPPDKCSHGAARAGIAKDSPSVTLHPAAVKLATDHTAAFVTESLRRIANDEGAISAVLGGVRVEAAHMNPVADVKAGEAYYFDVDPYKKNLTVIWGWNSLLGLSNPISSGPEGTPNVNSSTYTWYAAPPMPDVNVGALAGAIFSSECPFAQVALSGDLCKPVARVRIGKGGRVAMPATGKLYLHVNDANLSNNKFHFEVAFTLIRRAAPTAR